LPAFEIGVVLDATGSEGGKEGEGFIKDKLPTGFSLLHPLFTIDNIAIAINGTKIKVFMIKKFRLIAM